MKKIKFGFLIMVLMLSSVFVFGDIQKSDAAINPVDLPFSQSMETELVYRFYSPVFLGHFYTTDWNEAMQVANYDSNWNYEGTIGEAFWQQEPDSIPVYRFWSPVFLGHFYTTDYDEMVHVRDVDTNWDYEGVAFYAYPHDTFMGSAPVYRFWSPVFLHHFYTTDFDEAQGLINNDPNWEQEGIAYNLPIIVIV